MSSYLLRELDYTTNVVAHQQRILGPLHGTNQVILGGKVSSCEGTDFLVNELRKERGYHLKGCRGSARSQTEDML